MKRPDITPAQIVALVQAVISVLVSFSVPISDVQSAGLLALTTIVASVLIVGDAAIRRGRAKILETKIFNESELHRLMAELDVTKTELEEFRNKQAA